MKKPGNWGGQKLPCNVCALNLIQYYKCDDPWLFITLTIQPRCNRRGLAWTPGESKYVASGTVAFEQWKRNLAPKNKPSVSNQSKKFFELVSKLQLSCTCEGAYTPGLGGSGSFCFGRAILVALLGWWVWYDTPTGRGPL